MCLCNGEGGIVVKTTWGVHFTACPDSNCTYDKDKAIKQLNYEIAKLRSKMEETA